MSWIDIYGVPWPDKLANDLCVDCGQLRRQVADGSRQAADGCGHEPMDWKEVISLIGGVPIGDGSIVRPVTPEELVRLQHQQVSQASAKRAIKRKVRRRANNATEREDVLTKGEVH